ncbi:kinase-like domain-containing protein [Dissophora ornata]|nr:kinase-like domain-containing protein [Dissophora ornata]
MVSQSLRLSQKLSQPTQSISTFPPAEYIPASSPALDHLRNNEAVRGWLINRHTLETCLVIRQDNVATVGRHTTRCCTINDSMLATVLEDTSTNGTYWNGTLIGKNESVVLSHGDSIRIRSSYHFIFHDFMAARPNHEDPEAATVERTYQILPQTLGNGAFARVSVAIHRKTKVQLAVKIMDRIRYGAPETSGGTDIENEVAILQMTEHANIIPVVDVIKTTRYIYIFMQMYDYLMLLLFATAETWMVYRQVHRTYGGHMSRLPGGDLFDYVMKKGPLPELEAKYSIQQHLHSKHISHRDIKPENILLSSTANYPRVLLTDFGMAREFSDEELMNTMCGTFAYMAPEVFYAEHGQGSGYGYSADCWSLGVTLYVILSGTHPFTTTYAMEHGTTSCRKMGASPLAFPMRYWKGVAPGARTLVRGLLAIDPNQRWSIKDALGSDWIQSDIAWLRQRYQETVLKHWMSSSQQLGAVARHVEIPPTESNPKKRVRTCKGRFVGLSSQKSQVVKSSTGEDTEASLPRSFRSLLQSSMPLMTGSMLQVPDVS